VRRVAHGEEVQITVAGRLVARLVAATPQRWREWEDIARLFAGPADPELERDRNRIDQSISNPWEQRDEGTA
jgi:antitoxin (DNA-binding transcriptional repressor) of toxin-antitoxin stability system